MLIFLNYTTQPHEHRLPKVPLSLGKSCVTCVMRTEETLHARKMKAVRNAEKLPTKPKSNPFITE